MKRGSILLAGFVGGILPYLLGMAKEAVSGSPVTETYLYQNFGYWVGTLIFGAIGGLVAFYLGETEIRKALAMGVAAPGLVLGLGQGGPTKNVAALDPPAHKVALASWLVGTAQAQEPRLLTAVRLRGDTLWVHVLGVDSVSGAQADLVLLVRHAPTAPSTVTYHLTPATATVPISRGATTALYLVVAGVRTDTVGLASATGDTLTLRLTVKDRTFFSGLARAFGVRSVAARQPAVAVVH